MPWDFLLCFCSWYPFWMSPQSCNSAYLHMYHAGSSHCPESLCSAYPHGTLAHTSWIALLLCPLCGYISLTLISEFLIPSEFPPWWSNPTWFFTSSKGQLDVAMHSVDTSCNSDMILWHWGVALSRNLALAFSIGSQTYLFPQESSEVFTGVAWGLPVRCLQMKSRWLCCLWPCPLQGGKGRETQVPRWKLD